MFDLSFAQTTNTGKYNLDKIDIQTLPSSEKAFVTCLLRNKQVMYDWGHHHFFACMIPFLFNYGDGTFLDRDTGGPIEDGQWIGLDGDSLHERLSHVFEGTWGLTAVDAILRMERSGIRVDLCGTTNFGPKNPKKFMQDLWRSLEAIVEPEE